MSSILAPLSRGGTLGAVGLSSALLLSLAQSYAGPAIEERKREDLDATLSEVIPKQLYTRPLSGSSATLALNGKETTIYRALRKENHAITTTGVAFEVEGKGYGGPIRILMAVDRAGEILGVRVLSHTETPGLGDKIEVAKSPWIKSFDGKSLRGPTEERWAVKKDGGVFDAFTGATITPRAVVGAVKDGLFHFKEHQNELLKAPREEPEAASAQAKESVQ